MIYDQPPLAIDEGPQDEQLYKKRHSRRLSKRMSMSRRLGSSHISIPSNGPIPKPEEVPWRHSLLETFLDYQLEYQILESAFLQSRTPNERSAASQKALEGESETVQNFQASYTFRFAAAEKAIGRCKEFTHGYGAIGLLNSLNEYFVSLIAETEKTLSDPGRSAQSLVWPLGEVDTDWVNVDYTADDWSTVQMALHLLQACRSVRQRLFRLEGKLIVSITDFAACINGQRLSRPSIPAAPPSLDNWLLRRSPIFTADLEALFAECTRKVKNDKAPAKLHLLKGAEAALFQFVAARQKQLQQTLLSPLFKTFAVYASDPIWGAKTARNVPNRDTFTPTVPTFSVSPTPMMQRVAEGLLNMPRLFEVYAEDDALGFSVGTLPFIDMHSLYEHLAPEASGTLHDESTEVAK